VSLLLDIIIPSLHVIPVNILCDILGGVDIGINSKHRNRAKYSLGRKKKEKFISFLRM
jgi:hypothetical protein